MVIKELSVYCFAVRFSKNHHATFENRATKQNQSCKNNWIYITEYSCVASELVSAFMLSRQAFGLYKIERAKFGGTTFMINSENVRLL